MRRHAAVTLSLCTAAFVLSPRGSHAKGDEWAAVIVGEAKNGETRIGWCTDKKDAMKATACALAVFSVKGGSKQEYKESWKCKGWLAVARGTDGRAGVSYCQASESAAKSQALAKCNKSGSGSKACKIVHTVDDKR